MRFNMRLRLIVLGVLVYSAIPSVSLAGQYTYDANGNRITMLDSTGTTRYEYDALNRLTKITNPKGQIITFTYDAAGRRVGMTLPNGITTSYAYDSVGQLQSLIHQLGNNTIASFRYTYDPVGNRTSMTDQYGVHDYAYDQLSRLIQATHPQPPNPLQQIESFMYDGVGNRIDTANVYNAGNQLLEDANFIYSYDMNGNTISKTDKISGKYTRYYWNAENKLTTVKEYSNISSTKPVAVNRYIYDGYGRRVAKSVNGTVSKYVYDNEDILLETDNNDAVLARYTHGPGVDEPLIMDRGGKKYYYLADGLRSITKLIDDAGNTVNTYRYDSFGNFISKTESAPNPFTYTGREHDAELGLYYYRARYYEPKRGRFLSSDPLNLPSILLFKQHTTLVFSSTLLYKHWLRNPTFSEPYTYTGNNPVKYIDPFGLSSIVYDSGTGTLSLYDSSGNLIGQYPAANNTTTNSNGPWPAGIYNYLYHVAHPESGPDGPYGSNGNFVFDVPGRTGMGVHSGRTGPQSPTNGCIRTTDEGTEDISDLNETDPLTDITVQ